MHLDRQWSLNPLSWDFSLTPNHYLSRKQI